MKILIVGAKGQLGCELVRQARHYSATLQAPTRAQMDITAITQVQEVITRFRPTLVINAAAFTNVDGAETETEAAFAANSSGPENLAQCCSNDHIALIHVSTDFVFDGKKGQPYTEDDPIGPLGVYGRSKAEGEAKIRAMVNEHIIVRTSWLYGVYGRSFVSTMLNLARDNKNIRVVNDQYGSPTSAADLAVALLQIAARIAKRSTIPWGTYHYSGQGITTWHEFAENILKIAADKTAMHLPCVEPITTDEFPTKAMRPAFSALDCRRIAKRFGIHPKPWKQSLKATINRIFSDSDEHEYDKD